VALGYDLLVAQGTFNNVVEGQPFWEAFYNARADTHETITFGQISNAEIDAAIDELVGPGFDLAADSIIWIVLEIRKDE
jgi:hypothetical protein